MLEKINQPNFVFDTPDTQAIVQAMIELYPQDQSELNFNNHFELVCAVVLSAQTTDAAVNKVTPDLFRAFPDPQSMATAPLDAIREKIKTIGLYNNKAKFLKNLSQQLVEEYDGNVPADRKALESLPGVGRKTASVVLTNGFNIPAFAVDTHVSRVCQKFHLVTQGANVRQIEDQMTAKLPAESWYQAHHSILLFGRYQCIARAHDHSECIRLIESKITSTK